MVARPHCRSSRKSFVEKDCRATGSCLPRHFLSFVFASAVAPSRFPHASLPSLVTVFLPGELLPLLAASWLRSLPFEQDACMLSLDYEQDDGK